MNTNPEIKNLATEAFLAFSKSDSKKFLKSFHALMEREKQINTVLESALTLTNATTLPHKIEPKFIKDIVKDFDKNIEKYTVHLPLFLMEMNAFFQENPDMERFVWKSVEKNQNQKLYTRNIGYHILSNTGLSLQELLPVLSSEKFNFLGVLRLICYVSPLSERLKEEFVTSFDEVFSHPWPEKDKYEALYAVFLEGYPKEDELRFSLMRSLEEKMDMENMSEEKYIHLQARAILRDYPLLKPCPFEMGDVNRLALFKKGDLAAFESFNLEDGSFPAWLENTQAKLENSSGLEVFDEVVFETVFPPTDVKFKDHFAPRKEFWKTFLTVFKDHRWLGRKVYDFAERYDDGPSRQAWACLMPAMAQSTRFGVLSHFLITISRGGKVSKSLIKDMANSIPADALPTLVEGLHGNMPSEMKRWWQEYRILRSQKELKQNIPQGKKLSLGSRKM